MEEALKNVMKETTDRILKFEEEAEKSAEEKREAFRTRILQQNDRSNEILNKMNNTNYYSFIFTLFVHYFYYIIKLI